MKLSSSSFNVLEITGSGFQVLGAPPIMGRVFTAWDAPEGVAPPPVAVIIGRNRRYQG